ncbi:DNA adenine methylase [Edwardsiella tarda]|uniref:Dam family site-specific DNA-(Adenine-N6)-methyltransferase n=1 Tax=Edwardsiella tarda ATCC 15947 = NBRC 105688 TaxID=667121 RepID=A0AC61TIB3_EDWTA|nr:Dam family site-specific DNA-(adenine-N6)-methyltransferase [Edwardsiella tarda]UAL56663.1 Dam family site-specific DNA-(adenine-N6)-methyltransferase [Edwardsiella tarda]UCQ00284.1 Dam family site-specific DNA-(adenine-N6)-methyltransferase [Edwardsiella tarda ATCC 15947 = NBRC 105688]STD27878.1 DNA adenine methylase [Edwardsiella tarda]
MTPTINKTPLKWAGSKARIMNELRQYLPAGQRLVEPFGGACTVMMNTDYPGYLIADVLPDLVNTHKMIASAPDELVNRTRALFACGNFADMYYGHRMDFNTAAVDPLHRAAVFLYLNRHGYNGLCRYNQHGHFNVPFGNHKKPYFPEAEIDAFAEKAQHATFICASYEETLAMVKPGDVIYCDPPYDGTFSSYHTSKFSEDDQYRLASILERLASEGFPIIASNSNTLLVQSLYRNFKRHCVGVKRSIGATADSRRGPASELIITANATMPEHAA